MTSWLSSRQRSILGTIGCSSRIACSTRASVEKPVLPRRLRDRPSFSNRISPSCWGEPIVNSVPQRSQISRSSAGDLLAHAPADLVEALDVEAHALDLHRAQDAARAAARSRPSPGPGRAPRSARAARRPARARAARRGRRPRRRAAAASPRSSTSSRNGNAAPRGLEQVGAEQRVVDEVGRDRAERLGVVGDHRPVRRRRARPPPAPAAPRRRAPRRRPRRAKRAIASRANSSPSAASGRQHRDRQRRSAGSASTSASVALAHVARPPSGRPPGAGAAASPSPSASSRRRSGSRSSNSRKTSRRRERSGSRASSDQRVDLDAGHVALDRRQLAWRRARASACSVRFCLRLAPEISSTDASTRLEVAEALQQLAGGLVADARDAGDVVGRVALEPVEVGDQLRRDPVAVDHRLVVVELGLGDPARGRHDPDAVAGSMSWKASRSPVTIVTVMPASRARQAIVAMTSSAS